jgi:hypothetical protein
MHPKYYKNRLVKEVLDTVGSSQDVKSLNSVVRTICIREHIDYKTLKSWIDLDRQHVTHKTVIDSHIQSAGLDPLHFEYAKVLFRECPDLLYPEIVDGIWMKFHACYSKQQVERAFHNAGWTEKVMTEIAAQVSKEQVDEYEKTVLAKAKDFGVSKIAFLDESSFDPKDLKRKKGKAPQGLTPVKTRRLPREGENAEKTKSSIYVMNIEGTVCVSVVDINTAATFMDRLENQILPACQEKRVKALGFDNASVHIKDQIDMLSKRFDIIPFYLPCYANWFNPTEKVHNLAKKYISRVWGGYGNMDNLSEKIEEAYKNCLTPDNACNLFKFAGMPVDDEERAWANRNTPEVLGFYGMLG